MQGATGSRNSTMTGPVQRGSSIEERFDLRHDLGVDTRSIDCGSVCAELGQAGTFRRAASPEEHVVAADDSHRLRPCRHRLEKGFDLLSGHLIIRCGGNDQSGGVELIEIDG